MSTTNNRTPFFPIQSIGEDSSSSSGGGTSILEPDGGTNESGCGLLGLDSLRMRHLSACEEESEADEVTSETSLNRSQSPLHSPRSRRLLSARSSPNIPKTISQTDLSDDEDDDIMELTTTTLPRPHPPRHSPLASPHLSSNSRLSPTLGGYSSDEETHHDGRRKRSASGGKRLRSKTKLHPLVRVDSASSDDSSVGGVKHLRHSLPKFGKEKLRKMIMSYRSVPSTPADGSGSDSFTDMLAPVRRPRSYSARTDSSLSDTNDLAHQITERFQLSDGEELDEIDDNEKTLQEADFRGCLASGHRLSPHMTQSLSESAICCLI